MSFFCLFCFFFLLFKIPNPVRIDISFSLEFARFLIDRKKQTTKLHTFTEEEKQNYVLIVLICYSWWCDRFVNVKGRYRRMLLFLVIFNNNHKHLLINSNCLNDLLKNKYPLNRYTKGYNWIPFRCIWIKNTERHTFIVHILARWAISTDWTHISNQTIGTTTVNGSVFCLYCCRWCVSHTHQYAQICKRKLM